MHITMNQNLTFTLLTMLFALNLFAQKESDKPQNKFVMVIITKYSTNCNIKLYKKKAK